MSTIGSRIRDRRIELGLSADDLAQRLGKNRATVYRYEGDEIENFPVSVIGPLAHVLSVSPAYLMGWSSDKWDRDDPYSDIFRKHLTEELETLDVDAFAGVTSAEEDYRRLQILSGSSEPLSLRMACEAAETIGRTMSYMIGEINDDAEAMLRDYRKSPGAESFAPRDDTEREIIRRLQKMDAGQQGLLLATLLIADEQNSKKPAFVPGLNGEKAE